MEKSIEKIWKEDFVKSNLLLAPKLNDLYNQKSNGIIEKFKRMMNINLILIMIFSVAVLVWWYFLGIPWIGLFVFLCLNSFAIYSKKQTDKLKDLDTGLSSYEYLRSFQAFLNQAMIKNAHIMRVFYPFMFLAAAATVWYSNDNAEVLMPQISKLISNPVMIGDFPLVVLIPIILIALVMAYFAERIYRWDVNLIYGRVFNRLQEMISDMEQLRK